jgi:hypothetical protein
MNELTVFIKRAQRYAKAIVAGVGSVLVAISGMSADLGVSLVAAETQAVITFVLAALTAFSTWVVPNFNPDGE